MKFKNLVFSVLVIFFVFLSSCDVEDAIGDQIGDKLPNSFLGTWVDDDENELIVNSAKISYNGDQEDIRGILSSIGETYAVSMEDGDDESDYYIKQPGSTDELQVSTFTFTQGFVTYSRVN